MNIALLENLVGSASNGRLLAAGPMTKQPGTRPYRLVLLRNGNGFTVHAEFFPENIKFENKLQLNVTEYETDLGGGSYFQPHELVRATQCFADRLARNAEFFESLYREEPLVVECVPLARITNNDLVGFDH